MRAGGLWGCIWRMNLPPLGHASLDAGSKLHYAHVPVAQRIEHSPPKRGVAGSIPAGDAIIPKRRAMGFLSDARIRAAKPKDKACKLFDPRAVPQGLDLRGPALALQVLPAWAGAAAGHGPVLRRVAQSGSGEERRRETPGRRRN